ncbi:SDR family NAD(P)-dependent oxidoreductase [Saccharopolyspora sp. WRP15-2]|uniref:SDR family NAD(P)-dependent oxidoreductase n=1 Tax=Saccharopolyspora oryzae TaxID=2997343 RepID=A0ABT4UQL3_9PSEU|nr:SDR family oxidoreductase [Saccharopolyspora oryzae]MDA3624010.1 SDR family NAD(P)-dependent oxidoreductase [Saccharopolyspora oryzae]
MLSDMGFAAGSCVVVTGAGSGIGRAVALGAAELGVAVAAWDVDGRAVTGLAAEIAERGGAALPVEVDASDPPSVAAALDRVLAWRTPGLLVNNAGPPSGVPQPFADGIVGVLGIVDLVTNSWLDRVREQAAAVVNVASIAGTAIGGEVSWYSAAKAGVIGYTRHLAAAAPFGVRVNAIAPGLVDTPRMKEFLPSEAGRRVVARIPRGAPVHPEEVAAPVLFLLSPSASAITGTVVTVDAGLSVTT